MDTLKRNSDATLKQLKKNLSRVGKTICGISLDEIIFECLVRFVFLKFSPYKHLCDHTKNKQKHFLLVINLRVVSIDGALRNCPILDHP